MWYIFSVMLLFLTNKVCDSCLNNWLGHEQSCYHFSHDVENWATAMEICKLLGSYLVEINSDYENSFIQNNLKYNYTWIGLTDLVEEGSWEWMTSLEPATYAFWQPGEPNNSGESENCAKAYKASFHSGWNDVMCSNKYHYVCEQEASSEVIVG